MGANLFKDRATGKTAKEAFNEARERAAYDHGHAGYTGTMAEKNEFTIIPCDPGKTADETADRLIEQDDDRIHDKWGPAGCIKISDDEWLFFGWASC